MRLSTLLKLSISLCLLMVLTTVVVAADANGTWKWKQAGGGGRRGGAAPTEQEYSVTFKVEGDKVSGKVTPPTGGRGATGPIDIKNGTFKNDELAFETETSIDARGTAIKIIVKYKGKVEGDAIKGTREQTIEGAPGGGGGGRGGAGGPQEWAAARSK